MEVKKKGERKRSYSTNDSELSLKDRSSIEEGDGGSSSEQRGYGPKK